MSHAQSEILIEIVFEIWGSAIHANGLHELAVEIRRPLSKIMDTTNFGICLYNPERDALTMLYRVDEMDAVDNYEHYYLEQVSQSDLLLGEVVRTNRALLIHKDEDLKQASRTGKKIVGTPAEVWLGVPMKVKGQIQSIIILQSYHDSALYGFREKEMLEVLSEPIAAALEYKKMEGAQFRDETVKQTLFNIASAVKQTSDLNELYRSIHQSLRQVIDLSNFFIGFYDKQKNVIDYPYIVDEHYLAQSEPTTARVDLENKFSLSQQVFELGRPLRFNKEKILKGIQETGKSLIGTLPEIWLGFPLKNRNEVLGIMATQSYSDPFHFSEKDIEILTAVSDQIGLAIDRKRADEEARKRAERLTVINRIGRLSATVDTLDQLLQAIYEEINGIFKPDAFFISFFDQKTNELEFRLLMEENKRQPSLRVPLRSGFSSKVILDRKPLIIRDYEREKQDLPSGLLFGNQKRALSWIGVPLKYRDQVIGLVNIQSYQPHTWNDEDIQLFFTIADQLAGMLEKARLFEETRKHAERLAVVNRIGRLSATANNLDQLLEAIYLEINGIFKPDAFFISFFDQRSNELEFAFLVDDNKRQLGKKRVPLGNGFSAKVIHDQKPLVIRDYDQEHDRVPQALRLNGAKRALSWIGVPLKYGNQIIGLVNIQSYQPNVWNEEDTRLFFTIADQIAGTIEKMRLFEEAHTRAERLAVINRIGRIAETVDNLDKLMETIYEEIHLIFKPDTFFIAFLDSKTDELETRFLIEKEERLPVARYPLGNGLSSKVIIEKKPLIIQHYSEEQKDLPKQILFGNFIPSQSWIGVPLKFEDQIIGLVNIQSQRSNVWNAEDIQLFFTIADQISGSIAKARLFEEARKRLERLAVLNRIGILAASALNTEQLLNDLYEEINAIFKPHSFFIAFYIENSNELEFKFLIDEGQKSEEQRVPLGNGLSSKVIAEKKPLVIHYYDKEKDNLPTQMSTGKSGPGPSQSWIGVPLMFEGQLIGIVNIQSYTPDVWNQEDQQLFFTIADQIGAIIQKARIYESLQQELSERKKAEEENKKLESQLRQAQKMEAIGTLAGGIAHDFNNVLYPIIGFTEMTMDLVPEESLAKKNLDEILTAADRAKALVKQILTFSRQQEYNPQPLRIQPILKEALKLMRSSMPTTISIIQEIEETCGPVMADPSQIHQIIMNLCTNAYHAMKTQGGILEVKLTEIDIPPGQSEKHRQLYPGPYSCLTVRDTGHGIDPLIMEKIFDPYFTTKPPGEGTGMGLALVHGIVKSFGGEILVTSQTGQGTIFQILLPRVMEDEPGVAWTLPKCIPGQGERVLVVDDEEQILNMVELMLQSLNYKVVAKIDGIEALEEFQKNPEFFDLVITDQTMPRLTGFELSKKILAIRKETPIILCTGFSELVNEELVKFTGIRKFILKPILKSQLSVLIREILDADK